MYELLDNWITPWAEQSYEGYLVFLALCIVAGFYLLTKGGDWLSEHSSNIACQLGVPPVVVGLTIVSIATSTPELFTSLSALRSGSPGLVLGNVIGSNIANVGLILGIALLLGKISTQGAVSLAQRHCLFWITIGFCLALLLLPRGELGLIPGSLLLAFICFYLVTVTNHALRNKQRMKTAEELSASENTPTTSLILSVCVVRISCCLTLALVGRVRLPGLWIKEPRPTCRGTGGTHRVHLTGSWYEPSRTGCLGQSCPKKTNLHASWQYCGVQPVQHRPDRWVGRYYGTSKEWGSLPLDRLPLSLGGHLHPHLLAGWKNLKKGGRDRSFADYLGASICTWMANS